jgi:hypothetical protein
MIGVEPIASQLTVEVTLLYTVPSKGKIFLGRKGE